MSMDAVEFVNKMNRMCAKYPGCVGCPIGTENQDEDCMSKVPAEQMVAIVEKWTSEHPIKTRQSELLRVIPNLKLDKNGSIFLCPATITDDLCGVYSDKHGYDNCYDCRKNFWNQEVE